MDKNKTELFPFDYFHEHFITEILIQGFRKIIQIQPTLPVRYLAHFLLHYQKQTYSFNHYPQQERHKLHILESIHEFQEQQLAKKETQMVQLKKVQDFKQEFKNIINQTKYHDQLLKNTFCNWLEQFYGLTGCYAAILTQPLQSFSQLDYDEKAHLNQQAPKHLMYIGASNSHKSLMLENTLSLQNGITPQLLLQQQQQPDKGQQGQQQNQKQKNYIYVNEVTKNDQIYYFRLPKLGAYCCYLLDIDQHLEETSFDHGLEETIKYNQAKQELDADHQKKQNSFREMYDQRMKSGAEEKELQEIQAKFEEEKAQWQQLKPLEYQTNKIKYVIGVDTLGQDRPISEEVQQQIYKWVSMLRQKWVQTVRSYLIQDIQLQINYLNGLEGNPLDIIQKQTEENQKDLSSSLSILDQYKDNQKLYNYQMDCLKLNKLKQSLYEEKMQDYFQMLGSFKIAKFPSLWQCIFYFLNYNKEEINLPKTNKLDWRKMSHKINVELLNQVLKYQHQGPKQYTLLPYQKLNNLLPKLQTINMQAVDKFNFALGKILRLLIMTSKLRKLDIEIRKQKWLKRKQDREDKISQNDQIILQKQKDLEQQRQKFQGQEVQQVFDQQTWQQQYMQQHPLYEIGEQQPQQIDNDYDIQAVQQ